MKRMSGNASRFYEQFLPNLSCKINIFMLRLESDVSIYFTLKLRLLDSFLSLLGTITWWGWLLILLAIVALYDIFQRKHTILHNFPIVRHIRYWLEGIGPELRQYIVANNREELPFNRIERGWIYASAKNENNYEGFGTDRDIYDPIISSSIMQCYLSN